MTIDKTFNDIWHVTRQRPLPQRALVCWAVITLGPLAVGASLRATALVARESMGMFEDVSKPVSLEISFIPVILTGLGGRHAIRRGAELLYVLARCLGGWVRHGYCVGADEIGCYLLLDPVSHLYDYLRRLRHATDFLLKMYLS